MAAQTQDLRIDPGSVFRALAAIGHQKPGQQAPRRGCCAIGKRSAAGGDDNQDRRGAQTQLQSGLAAQMEAVHAADDDPAQQGADDAEGGHQDDAPGVVGGDGVAHGDTGEEADQAGQGMQQGDAGEGIAVAASLAAGEGSGLVSGALEAVTGGIGHHLPTEQIPEAALLENAALIAHVHLLVQEHPSVVVEVDDQIAQLCPLEHHGCQIAGAAGQIGGHLSGAQTLGGGGAAQGNAGKGAHAQEPVQQRSSGADGHGNGIKLQTAAEGLTGGEHARRCGKIHEEGLGVLQLLGDAAPDGAAADGGRHLPLDVLTVVAAVEGGNGVEAAGHGDLKAHVLNRIGEAVEHGHGDGLFAIIVRFYNGVDLIGDGARIQADLAVEMAQIHRGDALGLGQGSGGAV